MTDWRRETYTTAEFGDAFTRAHSRLSDDEKAALYLSGKRETKHKSMGSPSLQELASSALAERFDDCRTEVPVPTDAVRSWTRAVRGSPLGSTVIRRRQARIDNAVHADGGKPEVLLELKAWCTGDAVLGQGRKWQETRANHSIPRSLEIDRLKMEAFSSAHSAPDCLQIIVTAFFTIAVDEVDEVRHQILGGASPRAVKAAMRAVLDRVGHPRSYATGVVINPIVDDFGGSSAALRKHAIAQSRRFFERTWPGLRHEYRDLGVSRARGVPVYLDLILSGNW